MFHEFRISILKQQIVVDDWLPGDDAEQVNQALSFVADVGADDVAAGGGIEDGEVDVGVGVGRVEEAAEGDGGRGLPQVEDAVDVDEVVEEGAVLVPALAGADGAEDGHQRREVGVDSVELVPEEGTS